MSLTDDPGASSPVLAQLVRELRTVLPAEGLDRLSGIEGEIAAAHLNDHSDPARARRCAEWAVEVASRPELGHIRQALAGLSEVVRQMGETIRATEIGLATEIPIQSVVAPPTVRMGGPGGALEAQRIGEAVRVAQRVATELGWDKVPWEDLVRDLISIRDD